jgi:acyl-CoA synthetase (AMP-forming)/AMP-acid ligase II
MPCGSDQGPVLLLTVGELLAAQTRLQPDHIGARDLERAMTFREWNARACRLAHALTGLGLVRGDRVAVLAYKRVEWAEINAAVAKTGIVAVPINFRLTAPEALFICQDSGVAAVIVEAALLDVADAMREGLPVAAANWVVIGEERPGWTG